MKSKKTEELLIKLMELRDQGMKGKEIASLLEISIPTYYLWLREAKEIAQIPDAKEVEESHTVQKEEEIEIVEPIFPKGSKQIAYFLPSTRKNEIKVFYLDGTTSITKFGPDKEKYKRSCREYNRVVLSTARAFYQANQNRNLNETYTDYKTKYELYAREEHYNTVKQLYEHCNISEYLTDQEFIHSYYHYCNFNQFLEVPVAEIETLHEQMQKFLKSITGEEVLSDEKETFLEENSISSTVIVEEATPEMLTTDSKSIIKEEVESEAPAMNETLAKREVTPSFDSTPELELTPLEEEPSKKGGVKQFEIYWYPFQGIDGTMDGMHPCVVISDDHRINNPLNTAIVLPITSKLKRNQYKQNTKVRFLESGSIIGDQAMTVAQDKLIPTQYVLDEHEKIELQWTLLKNLGFDISRSTEDIAALLELKSQILEENERLSRKTEELKIEIEKEQAELLVAKNRHTNYVLQYQIKQKEAAKNRRRK